MEPHVSRSVKGRLGDRLLESGVIARTQLEVALGEQRRVHRPLGEILVSLGFAGDADIARLVADDLGLEFLRADDVVPDAEVVAGLDSAFVRESQAFPFALENGVLRVAMVSPDDPHKVGLVRARFPHPLDLAITTEGDIQALLADNLQVQTNRVAEIFTLMRDEDGDERGDVPVERLTHALLLDGIHRGATDIHVEPEEHVTRVRYRVDGILQQGENLPVQATPAVISRIKVLSNLDISERRRPQDGRLRIEVDDRKIDMRVSMMPSAFGENVVLRILDSSAGSLRLSQLGISEEHQAMLQAVADRSHGVFLVTGPTGSGKTTTLYGMLGQIDAMQRKVATIEDPIEYRQPLLRQSQVDPTIGYTFHQGLRSLLRQDPDVILVGEIRDAETADMAIKAAMTGHLVFATLHTNSALGAIPRLVDIGIEQFLVEDNLIGVMGQRLVRRICKYCRTEGPPTPEEIEWLGCEPEALWRGEGCARCHLSGYSGRTVLVELYLPAPDSEAGSTLSRDFAPIVEAGRDAGYFAMEEEGRRLVLEGRTTVEEVMRVYRSHRLGRSERA